MPPASPDENGQNTVALPDIYMVEDDPALIVEMAELVRRFGFDVMTFTAPSAALAEIAGADRPFIVVTDVMMPELTGHALVQKIEETDGAAYPHEVIMVSGESGFDEALKAMSLGVMDFLPKPVDGRKLRQVLNRAVERIQEQVVQVSSQSRLEAGLNALKRMTDALTRDLSAPPKTAVAPPAPNNVTPFPISSAADSAPKQQAHKPATPKVLARPVALQNVDPLADDQCMIAAIKLMQNMRRVRDRLFPDCADGDPSFDILLYVEEQALLGRSVSVTSACHAALIPQTTAMRKIDELVAKDLLERLPDPRDKRRILLQPASKADEALRQYLAGAVEQINGAFEFGGKAFAPHRDAAE